MLILGDCIEAMNTRILPGTVHAVICDPPYKMTSTGNSCRPNYIPNGQVLKNGLVPDVKAWMTAVYRSLSEQGHFYTFVNRNDLSTYLNIAKSVGFRFHNTISMIKDTKMPNRWYLKFTELILFFFKGKARSINDMTSRDYVNVKMPKAPTKLHPTEKPLSLVSNLITNSTNPHQIVLDPFMGSGTTGVACKNTNRKFIGIENDPEYFQIAEQRIRND